MLGQVAMLRGCLLGVHGQVENATSHMRQALAAFDPGRTLYQVAAVGLGLCYVVGGRLEEARALFEQNASITDARHSILIPITAVLGLGRLHILLGNLQTAKQLYEQALRDCMNAGWQDFPACGILHIGLGKVHYEMNELASAEQQLLRGVQMTAAGMHLVNAWGHALLAQTRLALGATGPIFDAEREASSGKIFRQVWHGCSAALRCHRTSVAVSGAARCGCAMVQACAVAAGGLPGTWDAKQNTWCWRVIFWWHTSFPTRSLYWRVYGKKLQWAGASALWSKYGFCRR